MESMQRLYMVDFSKGIVRQLEPDEEPGPKSVYRCGIPFDLQATPDVSKDLERGREAWAGPGVYCASEIALEASAYAYPGNDAALLAESLIACHHPDLGLDRSVCLRDIVEAIAMTAYDGQIARNRAVHFLRREFGGDDG